MSSLYRNLPMGALIGFEAAARLESFSLAATELNMTQSAISHQIKALETQLGQPLFRRVNRGGWRVFRLSDLLGRNQLRCSVGRCRRYRRERDLCR